MTKLRTGEGQQKTADENVKKTEKNGTVNHITFGVFKREAVLGDLETLRTPERRMIRIDLGADVGRGLAALTRALEIALLNGLSVK